MRSLRLAFLKVNRKAASEATAEATFEGRWTAPYLARLHSWLDDQVEAIAPTPLTCKKCGSETDAVHLWLCRGCFHDMDMGVEFDPEWDPKDL